MQRSMALQWLDLYIMLGDGSSDCTKELVEPNAIYIISALEHRSRAGFWFQTSRWLWNSMWFRASAPILKPSYAASGSFLEIYIHNQLYHSRCWRHILVLWNHATSRFSSQHPAVAACRKQNCSTRAPRATLTQLLKDHLFTILYFNVAGSVPGLLVTIRHLLAAPHLLTHTPLPVHVVSARSISLSAASCTRGQLPHLFSSRLAGLAKLPLPFLGLPPRQHINPSSVQLNHLFPNSKCQAYRGIRSDLAWLVTHLGSFWFGLFSLR